MLRRLLRDVVTVLNSDPNTTYWLDFGALLGITRDGDLIKHDNDVDMAVLDPNWPQLFQFVQSKLGKKYAVRIVTPIDKPESQWIRIYCPLGMCDLFGAYTSDVGCEDIRVDCGHGDTMHIPRSLILPLTNTLIWRGTKISVPGDLEGTLRHRYGEDYMVPKYAEKGADSIENQKPYMKVMRALGKAGIHF